MLYSSLLTSSKPLSIFLYTQYTHPYLAHSLQKDVPVAKHCEIIAWHLLLRYDTVEGKSDSNGEGGLPNFRFRGDKILQNLNFFSNNE